MLMTLIILPPLFYRAGKTTGENLTRLRGEYRQQLTAWLQGQAELTLFWRQQALPRPHGKYGAELA